MKKSKPTLLVKRRDLKYGKEYDVTLKEAKEAFLSGMSKSFKKKVNVKFVK